MTHKSPIWIPTITRCLQVHSLDVGSDPEVGSDDTFLALEADTGDHYHLKLTREAAVSLNRVLTALVREKYGPVQ